MPILNQQYMTLEKSEERIEFRAAFEKASIQEQTIALRIQNTNSLEKLKDSYNNLIQNFSAVQPAAHIQRWKSIVNVMESEIQSRAIGRIIPEEGQKLMSIVRNDSKDSYVRLIVPKALKPTIENILGKYVSEDKELRVFAINPRVIFLDKKKIEGHEDEIAAALQASVLNKKSPVQLEPAADSEKTIPKLPEEQHKTKVSVDIQPIIKAYQEKFIDRKIEKDEKGNAVLAFKGMNEVNVFFTDMSKKVKTPFLATEVGKDNHFYSCGDGNLRTGSMKDIHKSLNDSLSTLKDTAANKKNRDQIVEGIAFIERKILSINPAAPFKTVLSGMEDHEEGANTPDPNASSPGLNGV